MQYELLNMLRVNIDIKGNNVQSNLHHLHYNLD